MGTAVRDLIRAGDRVVGVQADGADGPREFAADLVIGTDGRYSTVRKRGAFTEPQSAQHFDVLNVLVPFPTSGPTARPCAWNWARVASRAASRRPTAGSLAGRRTMSTAIKLREVAYPALFAATA